jgi:hypothetical protein
MFRGQLQAGHCTVIECVEGRRAEPNPWQGEEGRLRTLASVLNTSGSQAASYVTLDWPASSM